MYDVVEWLGDREVVSSEVVGACQIELTAGGALGSAAILSRWSRRIRPGFVSRGSVLSEVSSNAIGVGAVEMDQVLVGLGHVDEHSSQKLEGVVRNGFAASDFAMRYAR